MSDRNCGGRGTWGCGPLHSSHCERDLPHVRGTYPMLTEERFKLSWVLSAEKRDNRSG